MIKDIILYDDNNSEYFLSSVINKPFFELFWGTSTVLDKFKIIFNKYNIRLHCNPIYKDVIVEKYPYYLVNETKQENIYIINSKVNLNDFDINIIENLKFNQIVLKNNYFICGYIKSSLIENIDKKDYSSFDIIENNDLNYIENIWSMIANNANQINIEFEKLKNNFTRQHYNISYVDNYDKIYIEPGCNINPSICIDTSLGPVIIETGTTVQPFAYIKGPVFIGKNSLVKTSTQVWNGTSIAKFCKICGEVENSIIQPFSSKQHYGYVGHSYIGSWVNLGAGTTTSNLKNNYSNIRLNFNNIEYKTQEMFLGSIIGDFTKTAIGTLLNTGTVCGIFCNLFGNSFEKKSYPNFSWGTDAIKKSYELSKAIEVANIAYNRKNMVLSQKHIDLIINLYKNNK